MATQTSFDPDLFVSWLAEADRGGIDRLRRDLTWLARNPPTADIRHWLYLAEDLGYLELDWPHREWRAPPCALTPLPGDGSAHVLLGARPHPARLADLPGFVVHTPRDGTGIPLPSTVWYEGPDPTAAALTVGADIASCAAEELTRDLTVLSQTIEPWPAPAQQSEVFLFDVERVSFQSRPLSGHRRPGLYRVKIHGRDRCAYLQDSRWYTVERTVGVQLVLPPELFPMQWLRDSPSASPSPVGRLIVDTRARLPKSHHKAAILCTGLPPLEVDGKTIYDGVPLWIAEKISHTLPRKIEIS